MTILRLKCRTKLYIIQITFTFVSKLNPMTNEVYLIKELMISCAELGALSCMKSLQPKTDDITQLQAYKKFGEGWIKSCLKKDLIQKSRRGTAKNSPIYFSKIELLAVRNAQKASQLGVFNNTRL